MGLTVLGDVVVGVVLLGLTIFANAFYRDHKKKWKQQDLMAMKIDAIVYGLGEVNSGIGEVFGPAYDKKLGQLKAERNFIES